ncbi:MAG: DUF2334 domain-containing protein [Desulfobacterium sp.]|nr:DUF2334 domain-containing protein [Desulfobacterium sp.]
MTLRFRITMAMLCLVILAPPAPALSEVFIFFRNDDISVKSDPEFESRVLEVFRKYNITPLYAVIPNLSNQKITRDLPIACALKSWHDKGWIEIGMHGFDHKFKFGKLEFEEQTFRIASGKKILSNAFDLDINWFAPPWNSANQDTFQVLQNNGIHYFSGYLGAPPHGNLTYLHCNSNLFDGPLGDLKSNVLINSESDRDVLLVALFHTSYDFDSPNALTELDLLLHFLHKQENVVMPSVSEYVTNDDNHRFLALVNDAGYCLKLPELNKY